MSSSQVCRYVLLPTLGENLKEHYSSTKFKEEKKTPDKSEFCDVFVHK